MQFMTFVRSIIACGLIQYLHRINETPILPMHIFEYGAWGAVRFIHSPENQPHPSDTGKSINETFDQVFICDFMWKLCSPYTAHTRLCAMCIWLCSSCFTLHARHVFQIAYRVKFLCATFLLLHRNGGIYRAINNRNNNIQCFLFDIELNCMVCVCVCCSCLMLTTYCCISREYITRS